MANLSQRSRYLLKLLVSCSIIGLILSRIDWQTFMTTLSRGDLSMLATAFVLLWLERVWAVFKWRYLLLAQGARISTWALFSIYNIGAFWGLFLPSSLSTDVVRGYYLSKSTANLELSAASVVVDRMMGLFSLLFLCLVSVLLYSSNFEGGLIYYVLGLSCCTVAAACCAFWEAVPQVLEERLVFFREQRLGRKVLGMYRSFLQFKRYPRVMFTSFGYSLVLQLIRVVTIYITALAFGIEAELLTYFIVVPITVVVIMIPISVGGLGVREGSFVSLFALVGLDVNQSFAISGTNSIMVTVIGLMGGIFYLFHKQQSPGRKASSPVDEAT
ncbi:lysylphosphatidylglycerol synthase transmembrane domain-containing protein [Desulfogranum mediterraneum]|uniref:lysylphosphatidylglycerol synthase transmembrane domain-containing protein n=1 Tax=Desulfogranum mediterraneum TaxID=160661 RepID=UPI0004268350|nr:lysylphosphatidylglycerol synthase transmembrane domain-containing protein [Desulfogranum mediterraneum]